MPIRATSFLLLWVMALGISAVAVAAVQPAAVATDLSSPWMVPLLAGLCYSVTFFLGRHYILPHRVARSSAQAGISVISVIGLSMALVYAIVWALRSSVGGMPGAAVLLLWFAVLWFALRVLDRSHAP